MKIKRQNDKAILSFTKNEWQRLGQQAGWSTEEEATPKATSEPTSEPFSISVKKYGNRTWAVYLNGELLCVTVYKKGAFAVESMLGELWQRIQDAEGQVSMESTTRV
jgi:hypothetical protein